MLQMLGVMFLLMVVEKYDKNDFKYQLSHWKLWLMIGFTVLLVAQTRNVGLALLLTIIFVFVVYKKYIPALFGVGAYGSGEAKPRTEFTAKSKNCLPYFLN